MTAQSFSDPDRRRLRVVEQVKLAIVEVGADWQPRERLDAEHVRELVEALRAGVRLPPLDVVDLGETYALVDGYHRHAAMLVAGTRAADLRVVDRGDGETARWWACAANKGHGLKRSPEEKRAAVRAALAHPFAGDTSTEDVADHCGVSVDLVQEVREEARQPAPQTRSQAIARAHVESEPDGERETAGAAARRLGVARNTVVAARKRKSGSRKDSGKPVNHREPDGRHVGDRETAVLVIGAAEHEAVVRALMAAARSCGPSIASLHDVAPGLAQRVRAALGDVRSLVEAETPTRCPASVHGPRCCAGSMVVRGMVARQIERLESLS